MAHGKNLHITVGICCGETWKSGFGMSLISAVADFASKRIPGFDNQDMNVWMKEGSILPQQRQQLAQQALQNEATHLLFLDVDQKFPHDTFRRLARWQKPVVACNIATKTLPACPTARQNDGTKSGKLVYSNEAHGLEQVWRVGTGVMMIDLEVFRNLPKPWFPITWKDENEHCQGEDWGFCELLEQHNIPIFVDHDLSREVLHIGHLDYGHQHCLPPKIQVASPADIGEFTKRSKMGPEKALLQLV